MMLDSRFHPTLTLPLKGEGMEILALHQFLPPHRGGERSEGASKMGVSSVKQVDVLVNYPGST